MRTSGVLMHISSLPSPYGIGTMGKEARKFADFLKRAGQKYWQILPICPTSYGDSPYQSFSHSNHATPPLASFNAIKSAYSSSHSASSLQNTAKSSGSFFRNRSYAFFNKG